MTCDPDKHDKQAWLAYIKDVLPIAKGNRVTFPPKPISPHHLRSKEEQAWNISSPLPQHREGKNDKPFVRFDLHGMTQEQSYRQLHQFLTSAQQRDIKMVLVITGKSGSLRDMTPKWLSAMTNLVSSCVEAKPQHGGKGALYVTLKRNIPEKMNTRKKP